MRLIILTFFLLNLIISNSFASQDIQERETIEKFIKKLINGKTKEAIHSIYSRNNFLSTRQQEIELLIINVEDEFSKLGKARDFEFGRVEELTPTVKRYIYQIYYDQQPVHFSIFLHKIENKWDILKFDFNTNLSIISPLSNSNHKASSKPKELSENIMDKFVKGNFRYSLLKSKINCNNIFTDVFINKHNRQMAYLVKIFGKPTGYELVSTEKISSRNNRFIYFLYLETFPVTILFDLYHKPDGNWCAMNYEFNDRFTSMEAYSP